MSCSGRPLKLPRLLINYTSGEKETDGELYIKLMKDGILETLEMLLPSDKLLAESFELIVNIISNISVTNEQCRDLVLRSKCYTLILERYPGFSSPQIHHQMSWLFGNLIRQSNTCKLSTELSKELLVRLKMTLIQSNHAQIANHTVVGIYYFLADRSTRQERLKFIFWDSFWQKLLEDYVATEHELLRDLVIEVLALCAEYSCPNGEWLAKSSIISELIKILRNNFGTKERITQMIWRYLTCVLSNCSGLERSVIRNDRELFVLVGQALLPDTSDDTKIQVLEFVRVCFMVVTPDHGKNILINNPDLVVDVMGILGDYDEGDAVRKSLVMAMLETLKVMLRFGRIYQEDECENWVKERVESAQENEILDKMAKGTIGKTQEERDYIQECTREVLSEFFEWQE